MKIKKRGNPIFHAAKNGDMEARMAMEIIHSRARESKYRKLSQRYPKREVYRDLLKTNMLTTALLMGKLEGFKLAREHFVCLIEGR